MAALLLLVASTLGCFLPHPALAATLVEAARQLTLAWGPVLGAVVVQGAADLLRRVPDTEGNAALAQAAALVMPMGCRDVLIDLPARIAIHLVGLSVWMGLIQPPVLIVLRSCFRSPQEQTLHGGAIPAALQWMGPQPVLALIGISSLLWLALPVSSVAFAPALAGIWSLACHGLRSGVWNDGSTPCAAR